MKKTNFCRIFAVALVSAAAVSFYSCGDDTPPDGPPAGPTDPSTIATDNLIGYWSFEDKATDEIGNKGTASNKVTYVTGRRGKAYQGAEDAFISFDVTATDKFATMKGYTMAAWMKAPAGTKEPGALFQISGNQYAGALAWLHNRSETGAAFNNLQAMFSKAGSVEWVGQTWNDGNEAYLVNKWFHVVHNYDPVTSKATIYINGNLLVVTNGGAAYYQSNPGTTKDDDGNIIDENPNGALPVGDLKLDILESGNKGMIGGWAEVEFGTATDAWKDYYYGQLDELRIYNKALSAQEVKALYDAEVENINK